MEKSFNTEGLLDKSQAENQNNQQKYSVNVNCKLQHSISNKDFLTNKICTSKYDFINALPKILCEQFSKIGNIYFLFLAILQMIPTISQSGGNPFMLIPLIFVVLVNGVKDFCEDYKRKQSDNRENKTKTVIFRNHESSKIINWEEVKPGDILKIYKDEYFPADICLLYSTNKNGLAYVETKNLDGETNLKYKESVKNTYKALKNFETEYDREQVLKRTLGRIECEMPNANMYEFEGVYHFENRTSFLNIDRHEIKNETSNRVSNALIQNSEMDNEYYSPDRRRSTGGEEEKEKTHIIQNETFNNINLDYNNFLLRGSSLRNTDYIYGIVIYCGHNTKIMLNSLNARSKQSRLFKIMNSQLKLIIIIQLIICLSFGFLYSVDPDPYLGIFYTLNITYLDSLKSFVFAFLAWLLTISNIVPISLLVTIEMIKFCQAIFISWDYKMYDKENRRTAIVQSSALNEELGQVHDIFTDKTGTLTKNVMQFRYMVIGDHLYGSESPLDQEDLVKRNIKISNVDFNDPSLFQHWADSSHKNSSNINNFIFNLALCHSVIVERKKDELVYNASSPDELALVNAAKYFGVEFFERTDDNYILLSYKENTFKFKLLHIFEFNSDRKRMSVVIKDENGIIKLICKGADSVISKRLDSFRSQNVENAVNHYLEEFGKKGLRTLMIAEREVSEADYRVFSKSFQNALVSHNHKKQKLDRCYESLEKDLTLIGATAIEDCLQDDLSTLYFKIEPTLEAFRQIGIKIWMLTGDHPFTAVSIGHSCGLVEKDYSVFIISSTKFEEINKKLIDIIDEEEKAKICLVITGDAIAVIQKPSGIGLKNLFLIAIKKAKCVICSRVSPKQKAELVLMVKLEHPGRTTLAIGDGANDVNMINSADVGIGIMGNEGQQAARASDYVIGQFSYLKRLMFVHGREAYRKNSFAVGYILWKNFLYVTPCIFLGISSYFSGQTLYDPVLDTLYNILFTAYPIGWFATYDKEINYDKLESNSQLYIDGMKNKYFNLYIFWRWYLYALSAGLLIYWICTTVLSFAFQCADSQLLDLWAVGSCMYTCIVLIVNLKIMFYTNTHNCFSVFLLVFSIGTYFTVFYFTSQMSSLYTLGHWQIIMKNILYLGTIAHVVAVSLLIEYGWRSLQFIIEEYIIKQTKVAPLKIQKKSDSIIHKISDEMDNKDFTIRIANHASINSKKSGSDSENSLVIKDDISTIKKQNVSDTDQTILTNNTGFAFAEDVANVNVLNENIKENFYDIKFE